MTFAKLDQDRIEAELAADADVLRSLQQNGDVATVSRPIDVRFVGDAERIIGLEAQIELQGWRVIQRVTLDDDVHALDVQRDQPTEFAAIRRLTEDALHIEAQYGVRYDGWGTVATGLE